ncbi:MAG: shikimate dehydrogenase [Gammaproteobacteria bacterium]|nr:shikimate dehydrogenase [Gammaproteobacteria bacterium]
MEKYAVMGNPINHSKSPMIHGLFAQQTGQDIKYDAILAPVDGFVAAVRSFKKQDGRGLNITVPFKQEAWQLVDKRSAHAQRAGAVNTISFAKDGVLIGDNTDGVGIVRDITQNKNTALEGKRILILGAGGAVRGIIEPILEQKPQHILIANRTVSKAQELVELFSTNGNIAACGFDQIPEESFDIIINGTSASLHGELPPLPPQIAKQAFCYDMMYGKVETIFMKWAQENGASMVSDGLGMLVEQAAESFFIWRGLRANTRPVIEAVRRSL